LSWLVVISILEWAVRIIMVPVILRRRLDSSTSLTWLTVIFFVPELGLLLYLLLGENRLARKRVRLHQQVMQMFRTEQRLARQDPHRLVDPLGPEQLPISRLAEGIGGMPIVRGNDVEFLAEAEPMIQRLVADIDAATHHVHLLYYIYKPDATGTRVAEALARAAQRGVTCRLIADAVGSRPLFTQGGMADWLTQRGVQVRAALPVDPLRRKLARIDLRNHRKIAVIDGCIGYTGSQNIVDPQYTGKPRAGAWVDLSGRFTGPIVAQLQLVFLEDWAFETGEELADDGLCPPLSPTGEMFAQTVATGPHSETADFRRILLTAVNIAQRKIVITSPYVVLDEPTLVAICMARERGVEVHMVVPYRSDHPIVTAASRARFKELLEAGVRIYLYKPGVLHAKTMTVDDSFALLGSANLDTRSFYLNFEVNVLMYGPDITSELRFAQMTYLNQSNPVDPAEWARRPKWKEIAESAAALLSPLL
jgi:cardiolipin synthase